MKPKKASVIAISIIAITLLGVSYLALQQSVLSTARNGASKEDNLNNTNKTASQNDNRIEIPQFLPSFPETVFIEPVDEPATQGTSLSEANNGEKAPPPFTFPEIPVFKPVKSQFSTFSPPFPTNDQYKDVGIKLLVPRDQVSVDSLIEALRSFGDFFKQSNESLIDPSGEFAKRDREVVQKTKAAFRNPEEFLLGEQCGLEGPTFSYPPGWNDVTAACGGTPGFGGTSCNTDPPCYYTGFCFEECYTYIDDSYCYCWVPSCYGICGNSTYIWDSVTGTCGCGT